MTSPFKPVNFDTEVLSQDKLKQLAANQNLLFGSMPKVRYSYGGAPRDTNVKVMAGKSPLPIQPTTNWGHVIVNFGTYFTPGCKPIVTATYESLSPTVTGRMKVALEGLSGELSNSGFRAHVSGDIYKSVRSAGFVHWIAVGY